MPPALRFIITNGSGLTMVRRYLNIQASFSSALVPGKHFLLACERQTFLLAHRR